MKLFKSNFKKEESLLKGMSLFKSTSENQQDFVFDFLAYTCTCRKNSIHFFLEEKKII